MIKQAVKKFMKKTLHPIILRLGYREDIPPPPVTMLNDFFRLLVNTGFTPKHIVDVGANHGTWTRAALQHFPDACYTLLEPQHWLEESIRDLLNSNKNIRFYPVGAGSVSGPAAFTIVNRDDSSTFRVTKELADKYGFTQIEIPMLTLNEFLAGLDQPAPDIIKIDAEGLDLDVLKGASNFLGITELLLVEAAVCCKEISNSFLEIINFMEKNNYTLFDITDLNRPFKPGVLWLTELAFVKKNGILSTLNIRQD